MTNGRRLDKPHVTGNSSGDGVSPSPIPAWLCTTTPPEHEELSRSLPSKTHTINWGPDPKSVKNRRSPSKITPEVMERMRELDKHMSRVEVARELKIAACTVTRLLGWKHAIKRTKIGYRK